MIDEPEPKDTIREERNKIIDETIEKLTNMKLSNP